MLGQRLAREIINQRGEKSAKRRKNRRTEGNEGFFFDSASELLPAVLVVEVTVESTLMAISQRSNSRELTDRCRRRMEGVRQT